MSEGVGVAQIPVQLNASSATTVTVDYATVGGTATPDVDYTPTSGTLTFVPGATIMTATVPITDDAAYELAETIVLSLTGASGATIGLYNPTTINLIDNDAAPDSLLIDNFESGLTTGKDIFNNPIGFSTWGSTHGQCGDHRHQWHDLHGRLTAQLRLESHQQHRELGRFHRCLQG